MPEEKAAICARLHTESSRDGVASHGLNRVERFVEFLNKGWVDPNAEPSLHLALGSMEIYNGNLGPGILNAMFSMNRATELAALHGLGMVSLQNTTHWMRGGSYGWQAADKGFIGICWTNTESCMPAWGGKSESIGNNPFVMAVPNPGGHIVLDMAMSQYSYGKIWGMEGKGQRLPFPGGFDNEGNLTDNPDIISKTRRVVPIGYWKGGAFAIMLDLVAALASGGLCTAAIDKVGKGSCGSCSQIFIAIDPRKMNSDEHIRETIEATIQQIHGTVPAEEGGRLYYPGEQSAKKRAENDKLGIPVDDAVWEKVKALA
jgi:3-dehydro-L-gulonate 2-dehydrogenase